MALPPNQAPTEDEGAGWGMWLGLLLGVYLLVNWWPALIALALLFFIAPRLALILWIVLLIVALNAMVSGKDGFFGTSSDPVADHAAGLIEQARGASVVADTIPVRGGDTLAKLAIEYTGDAARWRELYEANRRAIGRNPDRVAAGQELVLPPGWPAHNPEEATQGNGR